MQKKSGFELLKACGPARTAKPNWHLSCLLFLLACSVVFGTTEVFAGPTIEDLDSAKITVTAEPEQIRWGDTINVEVSAFNSTGSEIEGGLLVSFDRDVLVLDVQAGRLLRPGDRIFNIKSSTPIAITRPVVELWMKRWSPGIPHKLRMTILPLRADQLRVRARASFLQRSTPPKLYISPGRMTSRSFDEGGFPSKVAFVEVSLKTNFRRAIRRLERNIGTLDEDAKRQFAAAIVDMLENPESLSALSGPAADGDPVGALGQTAPYITSRLKNDPIVALDKLRCIMVRLDCSNGLVYFGMPMAMFEKLGVEEVLEQEAKILVGADKGADNFIALLEAEGLTLSKTKATGAVCVYVNNMLVCAGPGGPLVLPLLQQIVKTLGKDADREHKGITPPSFAALLAKLSNSVSSNSANRLEKR